MAINVAANKAFILYDSILEDGTLSLTGAGSPTVVAGALANIIDRLTFTTATISLSSFRVDCDLGSGNSAKADTFAMTGHVYHRATGATALGGFTLDVQWSDNGSSYTSVPGVTPEAKTDRTFIHSWDGDGSAHRYWRIAITDDGAIPDASSVKIATMALGLRLDIGYMSDGFDDYGLSLKYEQARSRNGTFLGSTVSHVTQNVRLRLDQAGVANTFIFDKSVGEQSYHGSLPTWDHFVATCWAQGKPFWFAWTVDYVSNNDNPTHQGTWYAMPSKKARISAPFISSTRRKLNLDMDVLVEGMFDWSTV